MNSPIIFKYQKCTNMEHVRNDKSYTMADIMFKASQRMFFGGSGV
jgi:hypothetical protein